MDLNETLPPNAVDSTTNSTRRYNKISYERRMLFLKLYEQIGSLPKAAEFFGINVRTARNILITRGVVKKRGGAHHVKVNEEVMDYMESVVSQYPTINLKEIKQLLLENKHVSLCESAISYNLNKLVFTTKNVKLVKKDWNDTKHIQKRYDYSNCFSDLIRNRHVLYLDEVPFHMWLSKTRGLSKKVNNFYI